MDDPFDLERFVMAQGTSMPQIRRELEAGRKQSHWMWFVFPQLRALGRSSTALRYGIASLAEAQAYMAHPVLERVAFTWAHATRSSSLFCEHLYTFRFSI